MPTEGSCGSENSLFIHLNLLHVEELLKTNLGLDFYWNKNIYESKYSVF